MHHLLVGEQALLDILSKYELEEVYISDINAELINAYRIIIEETDGIIDMLKVMQDEFLPI